MTNDGITCPKKLKERIAALESSRREQIRKNHEEEYRAGLDDDGSEPYQFDLEAIKLRDKIMKRKQQLKQAIISVGPTDTRPISPKIRQNEVIDYLRKNKNKVPGKPQELETSALMKYVDHGEKMNSGTPGIKRFNRKQFAKQLEFKIQELKIAKEHKHSIQFRVARLAEYKPGELKETGKFWKYWLLNAKQTNGNGWGVSNQTIRQNIARFIGRPFVITDKSWIDDTEYSTYEHPYLPTNHLPTIFNHQAKFRVGDIVDVFEDKNGDYFATIKPLEKFANRSPPPFCSPAVFQLDPREPENNISKWEALHLAGLDRDPAYGPAVAMLKGTCIGTPHECKIQFHGARQEEPTSRFNPRTPLKKEVPFGPTTQEENNEDNEYREEVEINRGMGDNRKIYPKYPKKITQRDRIRIIKAKIDKSQQMLAYEDKPRLQINPNPHSTIHPSFKLRKDSIKETPELTEYAPRNRITKMKQLKNELNKDSSFYSEKLNLKTNFKRLGAKIQRAQQMLALAVNEDVIKAFKNKKPLKGRAYSTDGNSFFLFGHEIARHSPKGLQVSNAGFPTSKTYDTLRALGVHTKIEKGVTTIAGKPYDANSGKFVTIPYDQVQSQRVYLTPKKEKSYGDNKNILQQRRYREQAREKITGSKKGVPLSPTQIQPADQKLINSITGIKSPIGKPIRAPEMHHILFKHKFPGLANNINNAIPQTREEHDELHRLNRFSKLEDRIHTLIAAYKVGQPEHVNINPEHGRMIADAYDVMKHEPNNPDVKASYGALISETRKQFDDLVKGGLKIESIKGENPYPTSKHMHEDIEKNNHLYFFPTEKGFGQGENNKDHPMMQETDVEHEGKKLLANDIFRIVHDVNGHHLGGKTTFGPKGEHQAYLQHRKMYSPLARKALFTETAAQNNWVNFSKSHGEKNRADPKNTTFAEQKAGLLSDRLINARLHQ